jgi:hypothetical protein
LINTAPLDCCLSTSNRKLSDSCKKSEPNNNYLELRILRKCRVKIQKKELFLSTSSTDKEEIEVVVREINTADYYNSSKKTINMFLKPSKQAKEDRQ